MTKNISINSIESKIYLLRGQKVMLDADLADLYQVPTQRLNEAVKRNLRRFPIDFMFQLTPAEHKNLISQFAISRSLWGGRRHAPYAFTEQGVSMLSSVLKSERAIDMNVAIMRAFVQLRHLAATHKDLALKLEALEQKSIQHMKAFKIFLTSYANFLLKKINPNDEWGFMRTDIKTSLPIFKYN